MYPCVGGEERRKGGAERQPCGERHTPGSRAIPHAAVMSPEIHKQHRMGIVRLVIALHFCLNAVCGLRRN
jgi:hypothetical protein